MRNPYLQDVRKQHPKFFRTVAADARVTLAYRAEPYDFQSKLKLIIEILRLCWVADAFLALVLYRMRSRLTRFKIPLIPTILHRFAMMHSQVSVGSTVIIHPGIYIPHGQIVIDGMTEIGSGAVFSPWVTIGLRAGVFQGPTLGRNVHIGTGAKIIGPISIGDGVVIGANAVVVKDTPAFVTAVGIPARAKE